MRKQPTQGRKELLAMFCILAGGLIVFGPLLLAYRNPDRVDFVYKSAGTVREAGDRLFAGEVLHGVEVDRAVKEAIAEHGAPNISGSNSNRTPLVAPGEGLTIRHTYRGQRTRENYTFDFIFEKYGQEYKLVAVRLGS